MYKYRKVDARDTQSKHIAGTSRVNICRAYRVCERSTCFLKRLVACEIERRWPGTYALGTATRIPGIHLHHGLHQRKDACTYSKILYFLMGKKCRLKLSKLYHKTFLFIFFLFLLSRVPEIKDFLEKNQNFISDTIIIKKKYYIIAQNRIVINFKTSVKEFE